MKSKASILLIELQSLVTMSQGIWVRPKGDSDVAKKKNYYYIKRTRVCCNTILYLNTVHDRVVLCRVRYNSLYCTHYMHIVLSICESKRQVETSKMSPSSLFVVCIDLFMYCWFNGVLGFLAVSIRSIFAVLFVYLFIYIDGSDIYIYSVKYLSICLFSSICLFVYLSIYPSIDGFDPNALVGQTDKLRGVRSLLQYVAVCRNVLQCVVQ